MLYFRYKPLIAAAMIASLIVVQVAHVPHVHANMSAEDKVEHGSRAHVHFGHRDQGSLGHSHRHGYSHRNGHSHGHAQQDKARSKAKPQSSAVGCCVAHDHDAFYLYLITASFSMRSTFQVDHEQLVDCHQYDYPFSGISNQVSESGDLWHPPDIYLCCPIYLMNMSIRC